MKKFSLLTALTLGVTASVHAGPITGKVALGSWNTQVQYDSVRVVSGASVLYANEFGANANGMTFTAGNWSVANGVLQQTGTGTPAMAVFGNPTWSNYTITLKARKTGGDEGFLIGFGMPSDDAVSWWNLGGWGNTTQALTVPGVSLPSSPSTIQANSWYDIKIVVNGSDIQCYLDNAKVYDTMRLLDDDEWADRKSQVLNSGGLALLPDWEQAQVAELLNRPQYPGAAARGKFNGLPGKSGFSALTPQEQVPYLRALNRNRLTWNFDYINDPNDTWKINTIINSVDEAVSRYNSIGVFDKQLSIQSVPGNWAPTADANYNGTVRFGNQFSRRTAIHEISHTLGNGTYWVWWNMMVNGNWTGYYANKKVAEFEGPGQILHGDGQHYWPYGQNYDGEWSYESERRTINVVWAFRRDMGINDARNTVYSTDVPNGTYRLTPRNSTRACLILPSERRGTTITIQQFSGAENQRWTLQRQTDGTYVIRSVAGGKKCMQVGPNGSGSMVVQVGDYKGLDTQKWYLVPMPDGWFKITPRTDVYKSIDLTGASSAYGTPAGIYDYFDGFHQQFQLVKLKP